MKRLAEEEWGGGGALWTQIPAVSSNKIWVRAKVQLRSKFELKFSYYFDSSTVFS